MRLIGLKCEQLGPITIAYLKSPNEVTFGHYPTFSYSVECRTKKAFVCEKNGAAFSCCGKAHFFPDSAISDCNLPFYIQSDASDKGYGAVLGEIRNSTEVVVAYASKTISSSQLN